MKHMTAVMIILLISSRAHAIPAFPGAEGFGAEAVGGRGGKVLFVTNLDDSGPGSLREAVEAKGPRTVIFRVSGTIALKKALAIRDPYLTIAGQTAPGDGICLKDEALTIAADHVIVRHLRCRPGDNLGKEVDAISIGGGRDIILDHCSASWAVDETLSASTGGQLGNVTVQWCIISESLNQSVHAKGAHGYGSLIRGGWGNGYSFHHNLYAHHRGRSPRPGNYNDRLKDPEGFLFDFRNNVVYNWAGGSAGYNADGPGGNSITRMNFVGNYYKAGPNSSGAMAFSESTPTATAYFADNAMNGKVPADPWSLVTFSRFSDAQAAAYKQLSPIRTAPVTTQSPLDAFESVLAHAGASLPRRDSVDARIVDEVRKGTGRIINDEAEVGGWPDLRSADAPKDSDEDGIPDAWEKAHGLDPSDPSDANKPAPDAGGYTHLEVWLNSLIPSP